MTKLRFGADCTLFILSYKNLSHLQHLLPSVQELLEKSSIFSIEVVIIENGNDQEAADWVHRHYPRFQFDFSETNDYLFSFNSYLKKCTSPYSFVLNNDLRLSPNILNLALPLMQKDPQLFAVSCTLMDWDGAGIQEAVKTASLQKHWLYLKQEEKIDQNIRYTFNACGGASIYRTLYFNQLGGFDPLYRPAYYEDTDLSHKAWNQGWKIINIPEAIVFHRTGGTWKSTSQQQERDSLIHKNKILGMVRNVQMPHFLFFWLLWFPIRLLKSLFADPAFRLGMFRALPWLPKAILSRNQTTFSRENASDFLTFPGKIYEQPS